MIAQERPTEARDGEADRPGQGELFRVTQRAGGANEHRGKSRKTELKRSIRRYCAGASAFRISRIEIVFLSFVIRLE